MRTKRQEKLKSIPPVRVIILSFLLLVLIGTILLSLPIATKEPVESISDRFLDALFTSTSATCVTGLVLHDTYTHWSLFGQVVILCLIQIGGLGMATFATGFTILIRQKLSIKTMSLASETSGASFVNVRELLKLMLGFTFVCETLGALILMIRFVPLFGNAGIWPSIFTAISAYCNAGFDVLGFVAGNSNLSMFATDTFVSVTVALLIIVGGLGFVVVQDIYVKKLKNRFKHEKTGRLSFHSRVCLIMTGLLLLAGTILMLLCEWDASMSSLSPLEKINASFFQSASARTAGFSTIDIAQESEFGRMSSILLMFIGACPGSTGGGIKTTTFMVIIATIASTIKGRGKVTFLGHRIPSNIVNKAITVTVLGILIALVDAIAIVNLNTGVSFLNALYEGTSAFATVGLSAGLTPNLNRASQAFLIVTMFIGRVGPVSFGLSILEKQTHERDEVLPEGKMLIG